MCIVSMVHDYGSKLPQDTWKLPNALPLFDDIVKRATEFDKAAQQPHCEDPEKLKFLEEVRRANGLPDAPAEPDYKALYEEAQKAADENLERAKRAEAAQAAATQRNDQLLVDLQEAAADALKLREDYDHLIIAYARMAADVGLKVAACGSGEFFTQIDVELPTGTARFFIDNAYAALLAGLPYGISDLKGPLDRETQGLRLTQAFNPDFDQAPIPEPMTAEKVLTILEPAMSSPGLDLSSISFGVPHAQANQAIDWSRIAGNSK